MGVSISLKMNVVIISGFIEFIGSDVMVIDLRVFLVFILVVLVVKGVSRVYRIYYLDRGYERLEDKINVLGVKVVCLKEK